MFVSASFLEINYGIDNKIAQFFVDREPPADNLYWKEKLLYLRPAPGYLFIPLIVDLLFRLGIDREQLLSERFVATMEQIGHFSALEETKQITEDEAIERSDELVKGDCSNKNFYFRIVDYFFNKKESFFYSLASSYNALQRGDLFLFSICVLSFPKELNEKVAEQWFSLIAVLLLMDDFEDIEVDKQTGDKNAFLESGLDVEGLRKIKELAAACFSKINTLNPAMALQLKNQFKEHVESATFFITHANP